MSTPATARTSSRGARSWSPPRRRSLDTPAGFGDVAAYLRAVRSERDGNARLQHGVELLPSLVRGCHHASVTSVTGGRLEVQAATDATSRRAGELQDELDEGPCLQADRTGHSIVAQDLRTETRWVQWCQAAVHELDVTAAVSVLLTSATSTRAMLNLYSDTHQGLFGVRIALLHSLADALAEPVVDIDLLGPAA